MGPIGGEGSRDPRIQRLPSPTSSPRPQETGFVVIINVSKELSRCDALALAFGADAPKHIPLPNFSYDVAEDFRKRLGIYLIRNGLQMRDEEDLTLRYGRPMAHPLDDRLLSEILRTLGVHVVQPIFENLGIPVSFFYCNRSEVGRSDLML
jgi:hypothetical protein